MATTVDELLGEVLGALRSDRSLHDVARAAWESADLPDAEVFALENTGYDMLREEGEPSQFPVGEGVMALVGEHHDYHRDRLTEEERDRLAYLGFLAMAADTLRTSASNGSG